MAESKPYVTISLTDLSGQDGIPERTLKLQEPSWSIKIGRASSSADTTFRPAKENAWFCSRVVSRSHAVLSADPENKYIWLRDDSSMHGTYLGGAKVDVEAETELQQGDVVTFGTNIDRADVRFPALELRFSYQWSDDERDVTSPISSVTQTSPQHHKPANTFCADYSDDDAHSDSEVEFVGESYPILHDDPSHTTTSVMQISSEVSDVSSDEFDDSDTGKESPTSSPPQLEENNQLQKGSLHQKLISAEEDLFAGDFDDDEISDDDLCYDSGPFAQIPVPSDLPQPFGSFPNTVLPLETIEDVEAAPSLDQRPSEAWPSDITEQYQAEASTKDTGLSLSGMLTVKDLLNAEESQNQAEQPQTQHPHLPLASARPCAYAGSSSQKSYHAENHLTKHNPEILYNHPSRVYDPIDSADLFIMDDLPMQWTPGSTLAPMKWEATSSYNTVFTSGGVSSTLDTHVRTPAPDRIALNGSVGGVSSSTNLKRKADDISRDDPPQESTMTTNAHLEKVDIVQKLPDNLRQAQATLHRPQLVEDVEHQSKRQKLKSSDRGLITRRDTTVILMGIALGAVGTIFGLAALPPDFFA